MRLTYSRNDEDKTTTYGNLKVLHMDPREKRDGIPGLVQNRWVIVKEGTQ